MGQVQLKIKFHVLGLLKLTFRIFSLNLNSFNNKFYFLL